MTQRPLGRDSFYRIEPDGLVVSLRVSPKASRSAILGPQQSDTGQVLKVAVTAPPDKGKANEAVIALIAKAFGIAKCDVTLISGAADRRKVLRLHGDPQTLAAAAEKWSPS